MNNAKSGGPNYCLQFTVSDVARLLKIEKVTVKNWSRLFAEFLSSTSRTKNGSPILFSTADLAVFGYVNAYWEKGPDIESIKFSIHAQEHLKFPFYHVIQEATPIFRIAPDDIDDLDLKQTASFGGIIDFGDWRELAKAYKLAGDILIDKAIEDELAYEIICPIIFNYRHATELFLKSTLRMSNEELKKTIGHDLIKATAILEARINEEFEEDMPYWFKNIVQAFNDFDRNGETFRYGNQQVEDEMLVDLNQLKKKMSALEEVFDRIFDLRR